MVGGIWMLPEQLFRRFPAGTYEIEGETLEGDELESQVELTHVMPAPAANPEEECDDENVFVSSIDLPAPDPDKLSEQMSVMFPSDFFRPGTEVKFEVLVREASFNQTAVESCPFEYEDENE